MPDYRNPPVFEVALDVVLNDELNDAALHQLPAKLQPQFGSPQRVETSELEIRRNADGSQSVTTKQAFVGWRFETQSPNWVLQTVRSQYTLNYVRGKAPPFPKYLGWDAIYKKYLSLLGEIGDQYRALRPRRVGLRYINRLTLPENLALSHWLKIGMEAPETLKGVYTFQLRQTWEQVLGFEDITATVILVKVENESAAKQGGQAVMFDIDLFNLYPQNAPRFGDLPTWFERAHRAENSIFESCITDNLRNLLGSVTEHAAR